MGFGKGIPNKIIGAGRVLGEREYYMHNEEIP